ncbi:hypothetical protein [Streptomyces sp. Ncost-T10-10d]|uniref:hypothetical protein n=1 Tax=Streptomyces sp. Ncost-T10-10d TaxID=1839774 RepID=UPI00114CCF05|nr:hypothetical protein [Streptomyces sp. Ncost-T10-10d]
MFGSYGGALDKRVRIRLPSERETGNTTLRREILEAFECGIPVVRVVEGRRTASCVDAEWRDRLHTLLRADPSARAELRSLLGSLGEPPRNQASPVHNVISGGVQYGPVIQTGRIDGSVPSTPHND